MSSVVDGKAPIPSCVLPLATCSDRFENFQTERKNVLTGLESLLPPENVLYSRLCKYRPGTNCFHSYQPYTARHLFRRLKKLPFQRKTFFMQLEAKLLLGNAVRLGRREIGTGKEYSRMQLPVSAHSLVLPFMKFTFHIRMVLPPLESLLPSANVVRRGTRSF